MSETPAPDPGSQSSLTRGQLLIWTGQQLHPNAPLYNMAFTFAIDGPIDADRFQRAFQQLVRDCGALRTVIETEDGVPYARERAAIADTPGLVDVIDVVDVSTAPDPLAASRALEQQRCERLLTLDERLFDSALIKLANDRFRWFFLQHHIVTDAWSFGVLFRALAARYAHLDTTPSDRPAPAPLPSFLEYAVDPDTGAPTKPEVDRDEGSTALDAPALYGQRPDRVSTRSARRALDLGSARSAALRALAQRPEARALTLDLALFNLLSTTVFTYLHRVSGARRLTLGAPFHNRSTPNSRTVAGLFTEVLPMTVEVAPDDRFVDVLGKVQVASQAFLRHASTGLGGSGGTHRSFSAILNFIRGDFPHFDGLPVTTEWPHPGHHDREHPLRVQVQDFAGTGDLGLLFDFNRDRFDDDRQGAALGHFERLLDALLDDWDQPIAGVDLLSDAERYAQLVTFNRLDNTPKPTRPNRSVVAQFHARVAEQPGAVALVQGARQWTYFELAERAADVARRVQDHAINDAPPTAPVVGIQLPRSTEAVVAILGVLSAGASYVPLDPSDPAGRRARMCDDAGVSLLIVESSDVADSSLPALAISLNRPLHSAPSGNETRRVEPNHVEPSRIETSPIKTSLASTAYVLFTSGSTGEPKGVTIAHGALAHYVDWAVSHYGAGLTFPLYSPLTFDLTVTSLFVPLTSGGTVVVYPETAHDADLALLDVVTDLDPTTSVPAVDIIKLTPSHLDVLTGTIAPTLRQLIFGGEALTSTHVRRARACFGDQVVIHNEYGPTEATVGCLIETVPPGTNTTRTTTGSIAIGQSIDRMRAYVLDANLAFVPAGITGDLYLAGEGLARGYAARPAQTAERFVPDPFDASGHAGARLYRTGDRARFVGPDRLVYVGRVDDQVKVRGARVELGDVERALAHHPEITACVASVVSAPLLPTSADTETGTNAPLRHCQRCGLASSYPDAGFDDSDLCRLCRAFEQYRGQVDRYFQTPRELRALLDSAPPSATDGYHCMALLSGGKDSTYVLCQLVDMGYRVLAFTLDNGFISEQAKANVTRVAETLGVDHVFGTTPAMNRIFVDSLERHANVCQGCFKTIYTLSMQVARDKGIPFIVTGLSRGQFFETRLTEELFTNPALDVDRIDDIVLDARKAYHRVDDAVHRLLDVSMFEDDTIFEQVRFVDFYRYWPVDLADMYAYLDTRVPWVRPTDTGRSTNCLINDVGIYVHQKQRGFHNYALPYSWDVRLGHKTRDAALDELDDEIDTQAVEAMLEAIDYPHDVSVPPSARRLVAYYTAPTPLATSALRRHVAAHLPGFMVPSSFVHLTTLPLTRHGKVDRAALPAPSTLRTEPEATFVAPRDEPERRLATIWSEVLRRERVGVHDNYFELGGDSIMAIQIVTRAHQQGLKLVPAQLFEARTVAELARVATTVEAAPALERVVGPVPLLPAQTWLIEHVLEAHPPSKPTPTWHHDLVLESAHTVDVDRLRASLHDVAAQHDAFRQRFLHDGTFWRAELVSDATTPAVHVIEASSPSPQPRFDLGIPPLFEATVIRAPGGRDRVQLSAHHLIVDMVSWSVIVDDLAHAYARADADPVTPRPDTDGFAAFARARKDAADKAEDDDSWREVVMAPVAKIPSDASEERPTSDDVFIADHDTVAVRLDPATTRRLLDDVPRSGRLRVHEALVAALAQTLASWTGTSRIRFFTEGHGRDVVTATDTTRMVGWLTDLHPVLLSLPSGERTEDVLRAVKDQLRALPQSGSFGGARARLFDDRAMRLAFERDHLVFNYLGRANQLQAPGDTFTLREPLSLVRGPAAARPFAIEVDGIVVDDVLQVTWTFGRGRHQRTTIEHHAQRFVAHADEIITCALDARGTAASDFPNANLDDNKLAKLAAALGTAGKRP